MGGSSSDLWLVLAALAVRWEWETSGLVRRDGWRWWETERREPATSYGVERGRSDDGEAVVDLPGDLSLSAMAVSSVSLSCLESGCVNGEGS
nr:hypothetical protein Iba_chr02eCG9800 [Ipomoea batatas]